MEVIDLNNLQKLYQGFYDIAHSKYKEFSTEYEVLWSHNNTRLLKFPCDKDSNSLPALLFIPSLLNKGKTSAQC